MKPNFLVLGAMKCATTSLTDIFAQHPQMFVSTPKEPEFFCDDKIFMRGLTWYESLFSGAEHKLAVGEGSTSYTKEKLFPQAAERVAKHLPEARLIYIVRHPLKRIESHWIHLIRAGQRVPPFSQALRERPHIIDTSLYWKQINAYRKFYSDDRILVLFFEDFTRDAYGVLEHCYRFLGVDPTFRAPDAETPRHVSADTKLDRWPIRFLQKVPGARAVKNLVPGFATRMMELFRKPIDAKAEWDDSTRRWAREQVTEDSIKFLQFYGKPADFWKLQ